MPVQDHRAQDRRAWILETLSALGLLAAAPNNVFGQHDHAPASDVRDKLTAPDWKPEVLSASENKSLISLGEAIVPGSTAANCNRVIDLLLTLETEQVRLKLRESITAFDKESQARWQKPLAQLSPEEQATLLRDASAANASLTRSFANLKLWVADVYWSSQQGLRELGYKGRMAWTTAPGCPHGGVHT